MPDEASKESAEEAKQEKALACDILIQKRVGIIEELKLTFKRFEEEENKELERRVATKQSSKSKYSSKISKNTASIASNFEKMRSKLK